MFKIPKKYRDKLVVLIDKCKNNETTFKNIVSKINELISIIFSMLVIAEAIDENKKLFIQERFIKEINEYEHMVLANPTEEVVSRIEKRLITLILEHIVFTDKPLMSNLIK
jgi:hypothetical protein